MVTATEEALIEVAKAAAETTKDNAATVQAINTNAFLVDLFGFQFNLTTILVGIMIVGICYLFWRIQASRRLDFADMFTKDGKKVSATKVMQFIGGMAGTWVIIKLALSGSLSEGIFGLYLAYVAGIEGYSKFISARYNYSETSMREANARPPRGGGDDNRDGPIEKTDLIAKVEDGEITTIKQTKVKKG